ncbi:hypothetical protein Ssi03_03960 [Sphaerisporangium siamense]|uniref:CBS domain-containing protein n=1 Tax=Sphaerisporangium siamense TaxID=795645 RepID=A0A7W7DBT8_9ACTN|nr:hypothetical protein [Sphaerisporangium siamense]MBB4703935.1 hypothetical protein [Sphaerisporangium siamense]GII82406.1 hypothetical protein Ssi03_03960 [Sphaerisporangium siamense]
MADEWVDADSGKARGHDSAADSAADLMTGDFVTKTLSDQLPAAGSDPVTVVLGEDGAARFVIGPEGPGPALIVPAATPVTAIAATPRLVAAAYDGLPLLVRAQDGTIAGIITPDALAAVLLYTGTRGGPDTTLHGDPEPVAGAIEIRCRCGRVNLYDFYLPGDQVACAAGHPFEPEWGR